jgi:Bacterial aa3 type cytochrome c oxidase subunit IV
MPSSQRLRSPREHWNCGELRAEALPLAREFGTSPRANELQTGQSIMDVENMKGHPAMDYREHAATFNGFVRGFMWLGILCALILIVMAATLI